MSTIISNLLKTLFKQSELWSGEGKSLDQIAEEVYPGVNIFELKSSNETEPAVHTATMGTQQKQESTDFMGLKMQRRVVGARMRN